MSAKLFVPSGAPAIRSGGETSSPSQVYLDGILPPGSNAGDVSVRVTAALPVSAKDTISTATSTVTTHRGIASRASVIVKPGRRPDAPGLVRMLSLIHISEPTRLGMISYAVFCLKK